MVEAIGVIAGDIIRVGGAIGAGRVDLGEDRRAEDHTGEDIIWDTDMDRPRKHSSITCPSISSCAKSLFRESGQRYDFE